MAPLSFAKLFSSRSSSRSNGSDRRSSLDSFESAESYVISLPSMSVNAAPEMTRPPLEPTATGRLRSVGSIPSPQAGEAEMLDDDNLAWGRPPRKQHSRTKARRAHA